MDKHRFYVINPSNPAEHYDPFPWSPLTDDGDAFRLVVALDLRIHQGYTRNHVGPAAFVGEADMYSIEHHEDYADGKYGATRRAIVRAAAAIGEKTGN